MPLKKPLVQGDLIGQSPWFEVGAKGKVTIKWTSSGREITVVGPARVRACEAGEEEVVVARGTVTTSVGAGARPGADVWLATPLGLLRWGDASLRVDTTPLADHVRIAAEIGSIGVDPAEGVSGCPKAVQGGMKCELVRLSGAAKKQVTAAYLRHVCQKNADEAGLAGASVLRPAGAPDAGTLGERTAHHIEARQKARGACLVAIAAAAAAPPPDDLSHVEDELLAADRRWREPPSAPLPAGAASTTRNAN